MEVPIAYAYEHTPAYQAVMLWRDHLDVLASGAASLMGWYRIHDLPATTQVIGDANNRFLGLLDVNGREKPAFYALRFYDQLFNQPTRSLDGKTFVRSDNDSPEVVVHVIEEQDGAVVVTGWLGRPSAVSPRSMPAQDLRSPAVVEVQFPAGYKFSRIQSYRVTGELISDRQLSTATSPFILHGLKLTGDDNAIVLLSR